MWRVYYDDGTVSDNEIVSPFRVVCIVQPRERTGREVVKAHPYYMLRNGVWRGLEDLPSLVQQVCLHCDEIQYVLMGIWVPEGEYDRIITRAMTDPGFPRRSAEDSDRRR